jgi:hypothetical protein
MWPATGIDAGKTVYYRVGDPRYGWSDIRNFTALPDTFSFSITVMADSGAPQMPLYISVTVVQALKASTREVLARLHMTNEARESVTPSLIISMAYLHQAGCGTVWTVNWGPGSAARLITAEFWSPGCLIGYEYCFCDVTAFVHAGQTPNISAVLQGALGRKANLVLNVGDLTYAGKLPSSSVVCQTELKFHLGVQSQRSLVGLVLQASCAERR